MTQEMHEGPWFYYKGSIYDQHPSSGVMPTTYADLRRFDLDANDLPRAKIGRLMAAAPELLAELESLVTAIECGADVSTTAARDLIARYGVDQ